MASVLAAFTGIFFFLALHANALDVEILVTTHKNAPLANAVVALLPEKPVSAPPQTTHKVYQENKKFRPKLSVIQAGTMVSFPNMDNIAHHVYSFSSAKKLEIPLYKNEEKGLIFETPGVVTLGCNIHDWMLSHIVVVPSPYKGITDKKGTFVFKDVPPGNYTLVYWHARRKGPAEDLFRKKVTIDETSHKYALSIDIKKRARSRSRRYEGNY